MRQMGSCLFGWPLAMSLWPPRNRMRYVKAALMLHRVSILLCFKLFFSVDVT